MAKRIRNFKLEYKRRVERGLAKGLTRARARGHVGIADIKKTRAKVPNPNDPREKALQLMKAGASQKTASKHTGVSTESLRRYLKENTTSKLQGRKWLIKDRRPAEMWIASNGRIYAIAVRYRNKSVVGEYWNAVNQFLITNDPSHLEPFQDKGIRDAEGKYHPWETGPNTLRKLDGIGELNFVEIYSQTAQ